MAAVMVQFNPTAFNVGGPLYLPGTPVGTAMSEVNKRKSKYVIQTESGRTPHINHKIWKKPVADNPQPPNSLSLVVYYGGPSWFETAEEFNLLPYYEIRSQVANAVEEGILQVIDSTGAVATVTAIRNGTVA